MTAAFQLNAFQPNAFQDLAVTGVLYATDQDDTGAFVGTVSGGEVTVDTHDGGFRHKELKQIEANRKRLEKLRAKQDKAFADANRRRKQAIADGISPPVAEIKKTEVELPEFINDPVLTNINDSIARLELEYQLIERKLAKKQAIESYQSYMAQLEAMRLANLDDEEALIMLL
jgi:hypothetical protein